MRIDQLEYRAWRGVPGFAQKWEERPSTTTVKSWIWKGAPREVEGTVFERKRKDKPEAVNVQHQHIFSVPNPNKGGIDPFDNYILGAKDIDNLFAWTAEALCFKVIRRAEDLVDDARRRYHAALDEQAAALKACSPCFPPEFTEEEVKTVRSAIHKAHLESLAYAEETRVDTEKMREPLTPPRLGR